MHVTQHGGERFAERTGLSKRIIKTVGQRALEQGLTNAEATGPLRRYMDKIYLSYRKANNTRIYNDKVYVFIGETLITVLNLPARLRPIAQKLLRRKKG